MTVFYTSAAGVPRPTEEIWLGRHRDYIWRKAFSSINIFFIFQLLFAVFLSYFFTAAKRKSVIIDPLIRLREDHPLVRLCHICDTHASVTWRALHVDWADAAHRWGGAVADHPLLAGVDAPVPEVEVVRVLFVFPRSTPVCRPVQSADLMRWAHEKRNGFALFEVYFDIFEAIT